jgi:Metallo-beta-lactamase superfamily
MAAQRAGTRFVGVPVGQGDAFFLETPHGSVLVDGGRSVQGFAELFQWSTGRTAVDSVICTHNDADHANGILGFLEAGLGCGEVWLPGRWLTVLPHALDPSLEVFESLLRQAQEVGAVIEELSRQRELLPERRPLIEIYGNYLAQERFLVEQRNREPEPQNAGGLSVSGWPEELVDDLEKAAQLMMRFAPSGRPLLGVVGSGIGGRLSIYLR